MDIAKFEDLNDLVIQIRGASVLLDADVAVIYGVETRDINPNYPFRAKTPLWERRQPSLQLSPTGREGDRPFPFKALVSTQVTK